MIKRKRNAKKALIIISVAVVICILAITIAGVFMVHDYIQKNPLRAPTWYICKQIEKEIPIGSDADDAIEYLKSKDEWSYYRNASDENAKNYRISETATGRYASNSPCFYSFSNLDYESHDQGCYVTGVHLGTYPEKGTTHLLGYHVEAAFVFDENLKLMDIYVFRNYIGIE